ncbi:hypothetical protein QQF64_006958 [Cirrhinus molitorella]|uniref:Uncharacterized protein n=1 Tax=Cirrhinus molitorella TaxID=172907 RepID=A0ABR3MDD0_9TELE
MQCVCGFTSKLSACLFPNVCVCSECVQTDFEADAGLPVCQGSAPGLNLAARKQDYEKREREKTQRDSSDQKTEYISVPLSVFLSLPPCLLTAVIKMIFSMAALFLCQAHIFFISS